MSFVYTAFGLTIRSAFDLPELFETRRDESGDMPVDVPVDVTVSCGPVRDAAPEDSLRMGPYLWVAPDSFLLEIPDVARFLVEHGRHIKVETAPGIDAESVRVFLLGSAFGALLFQRGNLVLHGNAIDIDGRCMVCVGPSGAGKSTLAAAFAQRGYRVLADDVVPIDAGCAALPGLPRIKLWEDAADWLGIATDGLRRIRPNMAKYNMPLTLPRNADTSRTAVPIRWIYVLGQDNTLDEIRLVPVHGMARFRPLRNNTYRVRYLEGMKLGPAHLQRCGDLAGRVHLARVIRPGRGGGPEALVDHLLADMRALG